ncbi:amidohydrolase family protein [Actinomadura barringtoniae]|nr:amidohydrolase family protein [Actinomadura barringtoniae]
MDEVQIVDAHVHLWEPGARDWYPDLHAYAAHLGKPVLLERHLLADYLAHQPSVGVAGIVHVSATTAPHAYLDEARWLEGELGSEPVASVTIGTVDPELPVGELVAHLDRQAQSPRFRGIRVFGGLKPGSAACDAILSWLAERGLVFDLVADPGTLSTWVRTLEAFPDLSVVLEHLGSPGDVSPEGRARWADEMGEAARATDWLCKFSGLGMVLSEFDRDSVRPWLEAAVDAWGWDRLLFGSNMPMDAMTVSHEGLLDTVVGLVTSTGTTSEGRRFFSENARQVYTL